MGGARCVGVGDQLSLRRNVQTTKWFGARMFRFRETGLVLWALHRDTARLGVSVIFPLEVDGKMCLMSCMQEFQSPPDIGIDQLDRAARI